MSIKKELVKEIKVPLTHDKNAARSKWKIGVYQQDETYSVITSEDTFCHIDEVIIERIFESVKHDLAQSFFNHYSMGSFVKGGELLIIGNAVCMTLTGIKRKGAALAAAYYLAEIVNRVLADIPSEHLDRSTNHIKNNSQPPVYEWIDLYNKDSGLLEAEEYRKTTH